QDCVIAMLKSPAGATIVAMMKATGWQQHSVRGFLSGVVRKRLKLKLGSKKVDGERIYQITGGGKDKSGSRSRTPPIRGNSRVFGKSQQMPDCLVADAVVIEPVFAS